MGFIYALSLDGKTYRYIGLTTRSVQVRVAQHIADARNKNSYPVHKWISKYGSDRVVVTVLAELPDNELSVAEAAYIAEFRESGHRLLNCTDGGDGTQGYRHPPEVIQAMRDRIFTQKHRDNLRRAQTGKSLSAETRAKISASKLGKPGPRKGVKHTEEAKQKMREAALGKKATPAQLDALTRGRISRPHTEEAKQKMREAAKKRWAAKKATSYQEFLNITKDV